MTPEKQVLSHLQTNAIDTRYDLLQITDKIHSVVFALWYQGYDITYCQYQGFAVYQLIE